MARYQVESRPGGPVGQLEVLRPDLAPADLRPWLADRLEELRSFPGRHQGTGVAWFRADIAVDDGGLVSVDVAARHAVLRVAQFRTGPHPAPGDWPRIPLPDLLDAAAAELRRG